MSAWAILPSLGVMTTEKMPFDVPRAHGPAFGRVLCGIDGSRSAFEAARQAVTLAQPGGTVVFLAITDAAGSIPIQYYDETGKLTPSFPLPYPAGSFPAASSFNGSTTCPNGSPYSVNVSNGLSLAQMMAAKNPPTNWTPRDQARAPRECAADRVHA